MLNVTAKLCDRNFGAKVQICFPRGEDYDVLAALAASVLSCTVSLY